MNCFFERDGELLFKSVYDIDIA